MKYITYDRCKEKCICGFVNIAYGEELVEKDSLLYYKEKPVCIYRSECGVNHFINNDDNLGLEKGNIIKQIKYTLKKYPEKWKYIVEDNNLRKYKMKTAPDIWIWNDDFYQADKESLLYILSKIK